MYAGAPFLQRKMLFDGLLVFSLGCEGCSISCDRQVGR